MGAMFDLMAGNVWKNLAIGACIFSIGLLAYGSIQTHRLSLANEKIESLTNKLERCNDDLSMSLIVIKGLDPQYENLKKYPAKILDICKEVIRRQDNDKED